ncbi:hypothetical protein BDR05DRAFT_960024 [Suillus weaverae]|nr:hypothetical protein BDR05DRAFT_960024 [Suillus weaverae]
MKGELHYLEARQQHGGQSQSQNQSQSLSQSQSGSAPPQQSTSYFNVAENQFITFGWNFSYILATPTHLTVSAVCENGNTYPVGPADGVIDGTATSVVWNPYTYQTSHPNLPLAQAKYTLKIWGDGGPDAAREPGVLTPNSALQFAVYTQQAYTTAHTAHTTFVALIATVMVVFVSGSALLRRI